MKLQKPTANYFFKSNVLPCSKKKAHSRTKSSLQSQKLKSFQSEINDENNQNAINIQNYLKETNNIKSLKQFSVQAASKSSLQESGIKHKRKQSINQYASKSHYQSQYSLKTNSSFSTQKATQAPLTIDIMQFLNQNDLNSAAIQYLNENLKSGYLIIANKKKELARLISDEMALSTNLSEQERESIYPLINDNAKQKTNLSAQKEIYQQIKNDINQECKYIQQFKMKIQQTEKWILENQSNFQKEIMLYQNEIVFEKNDNELILQQNKIKLQSNSKTLQQLQGTLSQKLQELSSIKSKYLEFRDEQQVKLNKIEQKSKMYVGIINH